MLMRLALLFGLLVSSPLGAETRAPGAQHFTKGVFCAVETVGEEVAEGTLTGTLNLVAGPPDFYMEGPIVPAAIGVGFGIHLDVDPRFSGAAQVTTTHPPMGPDGITEQSWTTNYEPGNLAYNGFTFEYPYELVQGRWTISAEANGRLVYFAEFNVIDPLLAPPPPCGNAPLS